MTDSKGAPKRTTTTVNPLIRPDAAARHATNGTVFDLDALLDDVVEDGPRPVRLGGREWVLRRDLTGAEQLLYWSYVQTANDVQALTMMLVNGNDAQELYDTLNKYGSKRYRLAVRKLQETSGLIKADEPEESAGKPRAS